MTTFTETIGTGHAAKPTNVADFVFRGYKSENRFQRLMGTGANAVINTDWFDRYVTKAGDSVKYTFTSGIADSDWVSGNTRLDDATVALTKVTDTLTLDLYRAGFEINGYSMSQGRTPFDLFETDKVELRRAVGTKMEAIILAAMLDTSAGRVQERYRYGASESNWNSTASTAKANVDATEDKLTLANIKSLSLKAKRSAVSGGLKMNPVKIVNANGAPAYKFIYVAHPLAIRDLKDDTDFKNLVVYKDRPEFDLISGSDYIGEYEGVMIYELNNDSMLEASAGASSIQIAHNFLLGSQAVGVGFGKVQLAPGNRAKKVEGPDMRSVVTIEDQDHGQITQCGVSMVTGAKQLVEQTSGTAQAHGIIHHYTAAVE